MPKKLINLLKQQRTSGFKVAWMRGQLQKMASLNQGVISMSLGR